MEHICQSVFESVQDIVFAVSAEHTITGLNSAFGRITGWTRSEWIGRSFKDLLHPDDAFSANTYFQLILGGVTPPHLRGRLQTRTGGYLDVQISLAPLGRTNPQGFAGVARVVEPDPRSLQHQFLQAVIDGIPDPIVVVDQEDYRVRLKNRSAEEMFPDTGRSGALCCYQAAEKGGSPCAGMLRPCPMEKVRTEGQAVTFIREHRRRGGQPRFIEVRAAPLPMEGSTGGAIIMSARDITSRINAETKLWESQRQLDHMLHHDPLTGLANRLLFQDRLEHALMEAQRDRYAVGLLFIDLDQFKNVNDTLGHEFGDRLLQVVAKRLCQCVRESDTVARLAGDEFTIILERIKDAHHASVVAQKIIRVLSRPIKLDNHRVGVGVSIGISLFPTDSREAGVLLKYADAAMYLAKEKGRRQYQFYTEELNVRAVRRQRLEDVLYRALRRSEFHLAYQPRVALRSGRLCALEAQVQWQPPPGSAIAPGELMEVAKDSALIMAIGEWVLGTVGAQLKHWQRTGQPCVPVSIALSAREFRQSDLVEKAARLVQEGGIKAALLELEVPVYALVEDPEGAAVTLQRLRELGVGLAATEFGPGNFSVPSLARFRLGKLKLDPVLVRRVPEDGRDVAVVTAVIGMAHALGLEVVAAGVEREEQRAFLQAQGCDSIQGPAIARPLPAAEVARLFGTQGEEFSEEFKRRWFTAHEQG